MGEIKISNLTPVPATIDGTEVLAIVQESGGVPDTFKATVTNLRPALEDNLSTGAPTWTTDGVLRAGHDIIAGYVDSGANTEVGGTIGITLNDGHGNANIAFNHTNGVPDRSGSSARITSTVDSNQELLAFQLKGDTIGGSAVALTSVLELREDSISLLKPTSLSDNSIGSSTSSLVNRGFVNDAIVAEAAARDAADDTTLASADANAQALVSTEEAARIAADVVVQGSVDALENVVNGKIGETEINTTHFTFSNNQLNLNQLGGNQIVNDFNTTSNITAATLRLTSTSDASATSSGHAFQVGATSGDNIIIDNNEIMARNNGAFDTLHLNNNGGNVYVGGTLQLDNGTSINEFSTDTSLGGNSDNAVPTEKAVKAYVDANSGADFSYNASTKTLTIS